MTPSICAAPGMDHRSERRSDITAAGIILLYCAAFATLRLLVSPTLELDEAEQFLAAKVIALGYSDQPPLFTWILSAAAFPFGMNIVTIIAVKYALLFFFYLSFYHIARTFWNPEKSLVVTGSLLLFPTYAYEFNRHLTHSILLAMMASVTCLVYVRLLLKRTTPWYFLMGISAGLGILSKYNFVFFLGALVLASISSKDLRRVVFDRRTVLSVLVCLLMVFPHFLWLVAEKFPSVHEAFGKAESGTLKLDSPWRLLTFTMSSFVEALAFPLIFLIFFRRRAPEGSDVIPGISPLFRLTVMYGLIIPFLLILVFHMGHFSGKWLSPVFFAIPLALFSSFESRGRPLRVFGMICIVAALVTLLARAFIGFFPDTTGKTERIHIPFGAVSHMLTHELAEKGITDIQHLTVVTDDSLVAANLGADIPGADVTDDWSGRRLPLRENVVAVWSATEEGPALPKSFASLPPARATWKITVPYIHSVKLPPYELGVAVISGNKGRPEDKPGR